MTNEEHEQESMARNYMALNSGGPIIRGTLEVNKSDGYVYGINPDGYEVRLFKANHGLDADYNQFAELFLEYQEVFGFEIVYTMTHYPIREINIIETDSRLLVSFHYARLRSRLYNIPLGTPKHYRMSRILGRLSRKTGNKIPKWKWEAERWVFLRH